MGVCVFLLGRELLDRARVSICSAETKLAKHFLRAELPGDPQPLSPVRVPAGHPWGSALVSEPSVDMAWNCCLISTLNSGLGSCVFERLNF